MKGGRWVALFLWDEVVQWKFEVLLIIVCDDLEDRDFSQKN